MTPARSKKKPAGRAAAGGSRSPALEARILDLEERLARLEDCFAQECPHVPWDVIAVAVAAVFPSAKMLAAAPLPDARRAPVVYQNLWCVGGRLDLFRSHRIR
jgi:hypothetical protein